MAAAEPGRHALLALADLRNGDTYTRLAAGFEIGVATAWRYVQEAIALLSAAAEDLDTAMWRIRLLAYAILDGTLIPIDRVADQRPYYSGKHRRHGVNLQVIADAAGYLVWASGALPGEVRAGWQVRTRGYRVARRQDSDQATSVVTCRYAGSSNPPEPTSYLGDEIGGPFRRGISAHGDR